MESANPNPNGSGFSFGLVLGIDVHITWVKGNYRPIDIGLVCDCYSVALCSSLIYEMVVRVSSGTYP